MDNFCNETECERPNSGKILDIPWTLDTTQIFPLLHSPHGVLWPLNTICFQALWKKALSFISVDPACPRPAPTTAPSACGTSSGTTSAKTCPKWRCLSSWMSRWAPCRDCVRSWSTVSCWTGLLTHRTLLNVWWDGKHTVFLCECVGRARLTCSLSAHNGPPFTKAVALGEASL